MSRPEDEADRRRDPRADRPAFLGVGSSLRTWIRSWSRISFRRRFRSGKRNLHCHRPPGSNGLGGLGEDLAAKELARRGIHIVARNRRVAGVEIDILGFDRIHDAWVIAEIKTSATNPRPEGHLRPNQRRRLERAGARLGFNARVRIVVLAVDLTCRPPRLEMFDVL